MGMFVVPLDQQDRWILCKRGGKGTVRLQVGHDGSAVGLAEDLESRAQPEEQGKGCWCNTSGYGLTMTGNNPVATPIWEGIFSNQAQSL